jgi:hypothetical protein
MPTPHAETEPRVTPRGHRFKQSRNGGDFRVNSNILHFSQPDREAKARSETRQGRITPAMTRTRPHSSSTQGQAAEAVRCWRPSRQARPPRRDRHENHRQLPARHGQRRQRVCRGFHGAFFSGEAAGGSVPVLPGLVLLLCAPDLKGERGKQQVVVLRRATATPREAANPRTAQEGRRGPAQKLPQASWPRRNR